MSEYIAIPLGGKIAKGKFAKISPCDYELVSQYKWHLDRYPKASVQGKSIYMHRLIMNPPKGSECDHIDRNKLNNTRENLRICTKNQNAGNVSLTVRSTSGFRGVTFDKKLQRWQARITVNKTFKNLGYFNTKEKAAQAYNQAALKLWGDYAWLNDVPSVDYEVESEPIVVYTNSKTGYRGVHKHYKGRYWAKIGTKGSVNFAYLGWFDDPIQAAKAYDEAAKRIYGNKAILNFP